MRGSKPGERRGGRTKGTTNKATKIRRAVVDRATAEGITPLELSLRLMRGLWSDATDSKTGKVIDQEKAMKAHTIAKDCAPFVHPKLAAIEHSGNPDSPLEMITRVEIVAASDVNSEDNPTA